MNINYEITCEMTVYDSKNTSTHKVYTVYLL